MTALGQVQQGSESAFPREAFEERIRRTRALLGGAGIDVMVVTGPENIFYLTGQQTPGYYTFQALVLPVDGDPVFIVRQLEVFNFIANTHIADAVVYQDSQDPVAVLTSVLADRGFTGRRVAIDKRGWFLPVAVFERLVAALGTVHDCAGLVESLRAVKSPAEIEKIARAAAYTDAGMRAGMDAVRAGASENDIVAAMMGATIAAGSEYVGMEPLVSSGPRCGVPHGTWRRRRIEAGDPVLLELAGCHDRYHAALMRTAWVGAVPAEAERMMAVCQDALAAAIDAIRPGDPCAAPHDACQRVIDRAGYTDAFRKRAGYSMGISFAPDWGEGGLLSLNTGVSRPLEPGMVFHIPPALRVFGVFTVGVSETVVVTDTGCRVLGTVGRDLLRVPA
jgi:Xaa-Pro dipeptidase